MDFLVFLIGFSFLYPALGHSFSVHTKIKFVNDLLLNENVPSIVSVKACWSNQDYTAFSKYIKFSTNFQHENISDNHLLNANKMWFFVDMNCSNSLDFVKKTNSHYFGQPYRWILFDVSPSQADELKRLPFLVDSNVLIASFDEQKQHFVLHQFYKTHKELQAAYVEVFGTWNETRGLIDGRTTRVLSKRRRDMMGRVVSVAMVLTNNESINHLTDYRDRLVDSPSKVSYTICVHLVNAINATGNFSVEKTWGYKNPKTGEFDGMTGQLIRKEADIGGTVIFMVPSRIEQMEFISMTVDTRLEFVFRAPPLTYVSNIYYYPFVGMVWIATSCLLLIGSVVVYLTYVLPHADAHESSGFFSDVLLLAAGLVSQMGTHLNPRRTSGQIAMFTALMCLLFVFTSYTAKIVALLQSTTNSIRTLEDLLNSQMDFGVQDTPYNRHFFPRTEGRVQTTLYKTKIAPPGEEPFKRFYNITYGVDRMRQGFFAFFFELGSGYDQIKQTFFEHEKCGLKEIPYLDMRNPWFAIQKHSPLKEILKVNVFKIREHGIQTRETEKIYESRPKCDSNGSSFGSVRFSDCSAVLLAFAYGVVSSVLVMMCEILWKNKEKIVKMRIRNPE